jgi:hypothetical protein
MSDSEYLNQYQAAVQSGFSPALLKHFTKHCPKYKEDRRLSCKIEQGFYYYRLADLKAYNKYLWEEWPVPPGKDRAPIPEAIRQDLFQETGFSCGLCSHTDDLEMAHIKPWKTSKCNHPHNLLASCASHHKRYDKGTQNALEQKSIEAVKDRFLEASRFQWHCQAAPVVHSLRLTRFLQEQADALESLPPENRDVLAAVTKTLVQEFQPPDPASASTSEIKEAVVANNKNIEKLQKHSSLPTMTTRQMLEQIQPENEDEEIAQLLESLADEECPHCWGRGFIGWNNLVCQYCEGDGLISKEEVEDYQKEEIDEEECPHCAGKGTTGLRSSQCAYCKGDTVVTRKELKDYSSKNIDEIECPHCNGRGTIGQKGTYCSYCDGEQVVSKTDAQNYQPRELDEVPCPRCGGRGFKFSGDECDLCKGEAVVNRGIDRAYRSKYGSYFD